MVRALVKLYKASKMSIPKNIKELPKFWSVTKAASLGGRRYVELYGAPGSIESRRKGGINSSKKFMFNPKWAKERGFVVRKKIKHPSKSSLLAEFIGILYGDGSLTKYQAKVTFNNKIDKDYAEFIMLLIKKLFSIEPSINHRKLENTGNVTISSINVVEFLT